MTRAIAVEIAAAVALELRTHTFTLAPETINRGYIQERDLFLSAAEGLRFDVQAGDCVTEIESRADTSYTCTTDIAVRKRFSDEERDSDTGKIDTEEIDRLLLLMQEIHDYYARDSEALSGRRLTQYDEAIWQSVEFRPLYDPRHLRENQQFTGIVSVTFRVYA